jgi:transcription termination factor 2
LDESSIRHPTAPNDNSTTKTESGFELPETDAESSDDDDYDIPITRKTMCKNRIASDDESSDEEEKLRKSMYEAESDPEAHQPPIEEKAFSKATRRSINGFVPRQSQLPSNSSDSSDDESDIILEDSRGEDDQKENSFELKAPNLSSTIRSPLGEVTDNRRSTINNSSFNNSISNKLSSTTTSSKADYSELLDEAAGGSSHHENEEKTRVSRSRFEEESSTVEKLEHEASGLRKLVASAAILNSLPDRGSKIKNRLKSLTDEIEQKSALLKTLEIDETKGVKQEITKSFQSSLESSAISINSAFSQNESVDCAIVEEIIKKVEAVQPKYTGKTGLQNFELQKAATVEKLEDIQQSIDQRPLENVLADPPKHLKIELMKHQLHGVAFMTWRETQKPRGGILADDMGLGKTLTTISLILKSIQNEEEEESESDEDEERDDGGWKARGRKDLKDGGTLVVCPASLVKQWEHEMKTRVKRGALDHYVFHGPNREYKPRQLAKYDVVITTYQIVATELKNNGCLFKVKWNRVVLDEGHVIRNHKSKQSEAVCALESKKRWVLTGTPIQNKEFDLFAAVKFLR